MPDYRQRFGALVASNRLPIRAEAPGVRGDEKTAVLRLYDPIDSYGGSWGVSAKEIAEVLDDLEGVEEIRLLINSPGGEVFEGLAILNVLRSHPARVVAVVEGVAASAASFIAAGADELVMARNSELFIHDAWGLCIGNAAEMRKLADDLDHFSDNIASIYADKAGGDVEAWRAAMAAETWYSADQAVEAGLADRLDESSDGAAADKAKARFDLTVFNIAGRQQASAETSAPPPSPSPPEGQKGGSTMPELTPEHLALLGLTEDASAEDIQARLTALATPPDPAVPDGHIAIPEARLRDLEEGARLGTEAANTLRERERAEFLDSVRAKYAPANRAAWEKEYDRDPAGTRTHFETAPDILPVAQIGNGGNVDLDSDEATYAALFPSQEVSA